MAGLLPWGVVWACKLESAGLDRSFGGVLSEVGLMVRTAGEDQVLGSNCC